jgi:RNA-binding protein
MQDASETDGGAGRPALAGHQRRHLRGLAQRMKPVVWVGEDGLTEGALRAVEEALAAQELVKVRLRAPEDKKAMARRLAEATRSELCGLVGHTVILYRPDPDEPRIELPRRPARRPGAIPSPS